MASACAVPGNARAMAIACDVNAAEVALDCESCAHGNHYGDCQDPEAYRSEHAAAEIAHARAEERCRMGRELHDSTSQLLVALQLRLSHLKLLLKDSRPPEILEEMERTLAELHREIRAVALLNSEGDLAERELAGSLRDMANRFARVAGIDVSVSVSGDAEFGRIDVATAVYRIAQEALANIHRHAHATAVAIDLVLARGEVRLSIRDNGVGISRQRVPSDRPCGIGLDNIRARVQDLSGDVSVRQLKPGTGIDVTIPLRAEPHGLPLSVVVV